MERLRKVLRAVDDVQQRHTVLAVTVAVNKKFGDDNGGVLANNLAYAAFAGVFPILLLLVTLLGVVLSGNPSLEHRVLHSALAQFPVIGNQLGSNIHAISGGSVLAFLVAVAGLVWSATGVAKAGIYSMAEVWNVATTDRPTAVRQILRSVLFLVVLGGGLLVTTALSGFGSFGTAPIAVAAAVEVGAVVANVGQYLLAFRVLTPGSVATRHLWPGAVVGGVAWTLLQAAGGYLVGHQLRNDSEVYGTFALVLGLVAWIYLGVQVSIYAAEVNSVLARRLWPRSLLQPPLTDADRRSLELQATQARARPEERIDVAFDEPRTTEAGRG